MPDPPARLGGFSYRYPGAAASALEAVDLELRAGELVVLAGRSASGKSTLLRALCGLVPHYHGGDVAGTASICGLDLRLAGPAELGRRVGMVAQDPESQLVSATPRAEIELPLELRGEPPASRARAVEEVSLALGVESLLERPAGSLSGGELQRVALAAALVGRPELILLDEPTSQLDPVAGDELIGLLRRLNEEWGTTVVLAEHRLERCLPAADRVVALEAGRIGFDGSPGGFCEWSLGSDPSLATPVARMFALVGLRPLPRGVKDARVTLRRAGLGPPSGDADPSSRAARRPAGTAGRRRPFARRRRERPPAALEASDLWVELDAGGARVEALRGVALRIEPGETVAVMGRNGAGKSTLLRACAGLVEPLRGRLRLAGGCALVPQRPADMLVRERVADELPGEAGRRALAAVGLERKLEADPRDLSGGERQRLALALATAGRAEPGEAPGLVCLDEPTRGMDRARKAELGGWIAELAAAGSAVVVATHDVEFASEAVGRVAVMGRGELLADGPADEVLAGGWYFATEVARALGRGGAVTARAGAELLHAELAARDGRPGSPREGRTRPVGVSGPGPDELEAPDHAAGRIGGRA